MAWSDPTARMTRLRDLLALLAAGKGRDRAAELIDLGGDLFDEGNLDGQQYAALHELHEALKASASSIGERATRCLAMIG